MEQATHSIIQRIAFVGNYLPRQCGIATFTTSLYEAIAGEHKGTACIAIPVNDTEGGYEYPDRVRFELTEKDIEFYRRAADFLNINNVDIVSLQYAGIPLPTLPCSRLAWNPCGGWSTCNDRKGRLDTLSRSAPLVSIPRVVNAHASTNNRSRPRQWSQPA